MKLQPLLLERLDKLDTLDKLERPDRLDRPASRASSHQRSSSGYSDALLRSPLTASCRSSFHRPHSTASDVDTVMLQSQVTTLQWQLRQAEASRQMHRAVMEQVVAFLQRTHRNLDLLQSRIAETELASARYGSRFSDDVCVTLKLPEV